MKLRTRSKSILAIAILAAVAMSGCNTVEGAGKDVESAGEAIQDAAD